MKTNTFLFLLVAVQSWSQCWDKLSVGDTSSFAIQSNGTLWGFGNVNQSETGVYVPTQIGTDTDWKLMQSGYLHYAGIKQNGTLFTYGINSSGCLGTGESSGYYHMPIQIGTDTDWNLIEASLSTTAALKTDGTLWIWGSRYWNGTNVYVPTQFGTDTNWKKVSLGDTHVVALKTDGTLWAWGLNTSGQLGLGIDSEDAIIGEATQIGVANDWKDIDVSYDNCVALKNNGTIWSWGSNQAGQLGQGTISQLSNVPLQIGTDTNWTGIFTGNLYSKAIKSDGTLWAFGSNFYGTFGNGSYISSSIPVQIGSKTWLTVANGEFHSLSIAMDGILYGTGNNSFGALGTGNGVDTNEFIPVECPRLDVDKVNLYSFVVSPNPTSSVLKIQNSRNLTIDAVIIYNLLGEKVSVYTRDVSEINIENLNAGIYLLEINAGDIKSTQKIIKI